MTTDDQAWETPCPFAPAGDPGHCDHWYDGQEPCCRCGDNTDPTPEEGV